jgi:hypothetical protein
MRSVCYRGESTIPTSKSGGAAGSQAQSTKVLRKNNAVGLKAGHDKLIRGCRRVREQRTRPNKPTSALSRHERAQ